MKCAWNKLISILPLAVRNQIDKLGKDTGQEIRMIVNGKVILKTAKGEFVIEHTVRYDDLVYVINAASKYSPWTTRTISDGYLTAPGGHRIGICGRAVIQNGKMTGISEPSSLCIRIARDFPGISSGIGADYGSVLILGAPGSGKTTLLRDLIRRYPGYVAVVDEKEEIFPCINGSSVFDLATNVHVMTGADKPHGIDSVLRNMSPDVIAVDEITAKEDCEALINAGWCAVTLYATAHARNKQDLYNRKIYRPLAESGLFDTLIILDQNKQWHAERISQ